MNNSWYLVNVVWYDGCDAFVSQFVLQVELDPEKIGTSEYAHLTEESKNRVLKYLEGNGEVLKYDPLHDMDFDNIMALEKYGDEKQKATFDRWKNMYF